MAQKRAWWLVRIAALLINMAGGAPLHAQEATPDRQANWQKGAEAAPRPVAYYVLESIEVIGNRKTRRPVILRNLGITPKERFAIDDERVEAARYRLLATGLFSNVQVSLKKGSIRGQVILQIRVRERNTIVIRDLMMGTTRIAPNWDHVTPYGAISLEERSLWGSGVVAGGGVAASDDQLAYQLYLSDEHFMDSKVGLHAVGQFVNAREYFGDHYLPGPGEKTNFGRYESLRYRRAGIRLGTGYNLLLDYFFWFDARFENILAQKPVTVDGPAISIGDNTEPVRLGYLDPDDSILTSVLFGFKRDTTNHPIMPSKGALSNWFVEISHPIMGSSYNYAKFRLDHTTWISIGHRGHALGLGGTAGLIVGEAPFFEQFFIGDYSAFVPSRALGLNFSNLHPQILKNGIQHMWYEDLVLSLNAEYTIPFYRGSGMIYGVNGFVNFGVYSLTSARFIDGSGIPMDITFDAGVRIDTRVGVFSISFANLVQLIPPISRETTQ